MSDISKKRVLFFSFFTTLLIFTGVLLFINTQKIERFKSVKIALLDSGLSHSNYEDVQVITNEKSTSTHASIMLNSMLSEIESTNQKKVTVFDYPVTSSETNISEKKVLNAMDQAIDEGVDIINMSFGFKDDISGLKERINKAKKKNIKIVSAAGNTYGFYTSYPAKYSSVISIGSEENDKIATYSAIEDVDYFVKGTFKNVKNEGTSISAAYFSGALANSLLNGKKISSSLIKEKRALID